MRLWAMVYFRQLPLPLAELDDCFVSIFFDFATTYTEDSVLDAKIKEKAKAKDKPTADVLLNIGYSDEDILIMGAE